MLHLFKYTFVRCNCIRVVALKSSLVHRQLRSLYFTFGFNALNFAELGSLAQVRDISNPERYLLINSDFTEIVRIFQRIVYIDVGRQIEHNMIANEVNT